MALEPILDPFTVDLPISGDARKDVARIVARQEVELAELRLEVVKHNPILLDEAQKLSDHVFTDAIELWDLIQRAALKDGEPPTLSAKKMRTVSDLLSYLVGRRWDELTSFVDFIDEQRTKRAFPQIPNEFAYLDPYWYLEPMSRFAITETERLDAFRLAATKRYREILHAGKIPSEDDIRRRTALVDKYMRDHGIKGRSELAYRLGMTDSAISGIIRDRTAYFGQDTKNKFLREIGADPNTW